MRRTLRPVLAALLALTSLPAAASGGTAESFARAMVEEIRARAVQCPSDIPQLEPGRLSLCAESDLPPKEFRKAWSRLAAKKWRKPFHAAAAGSWFRGDISYERHYMVDGTDLAVYRQMQGPLFAIVWDQDLVACDDDWHDSHPRVLAETEAGLRFPEPVHKVPPRYPLEARQKRADAIVILEAVIRTDGTVGDICVVRADKRSLGFPRSAVDAVRRWRYKPATRDGQIMEVTIPITITFDIH